jgi:hypothetical protein
MEDPEYDFEEAAEVAYENISPILQEKFTEEDILQILLVQNDYYDTIGLTTEEDSISEYPIDVDHEQMKYYIIHNCVEMDIILTDDELEEILDGEYKYLEQIGLIDEDGNRFLN